MLQNILICLGVAAAVAFAAGILLAVSSYFFAVKEDEKVVKLRECLPGANCGACGYAGCDSYAKALVEEGAKANLCIPGADSAAQGIAQILGCDVECVDSCVAVVNCNGNCKSVKKKAEYAGVKTCRASSMIFAGELECRFGCMGCGDCADVCPSHAICVEAGVAVIDRDLCIGCGLCAKTCPKKIISMVPKCADVKVLCSNEDKGPAARKACINSCIGCKKCQMNCEAEAIKVENNLARIDYSKCTSCGKCREVCPTKCIH